MFPANKKRSVSDIATGPSNPWRPILKPVGYTSEQRLSAIKFVEPKNKRRRVSGPCTTSPHPKERFSRSLAIEPIGYTEYQQIPQRANTERRRGPLAEKENNRCNSSTNHTTTSNTPKGPRRILKPASRRSLKSSPKPPHPDITIEPNDGTLPPGYIGTYKNIQYYNPSLGLNAQSCDGGSLHLLVCGHWILDTNHGLCGMNCKSPASAAPFNCPQCLAFLTNILKTRPTPAEQHKISTIKALGTKILLLAYTVELCTKYAKDFLGNITETILACMENGFGRYCVGSVPPEPQAYLSIQELVAHVEAQRQRKKFEIEHKGRKGVKRKIIDMAMDKEFGGGENQEGQQKKQKLKRGGYVEVSWAEKKKGVGAIERKRGNDEDEDHDEIEKVCAPREKKMRFGRDERL